MRDGQQQQDRHDDPPPEYAPAIHRVSEGRDYRPRGRELRLLLTRTSNSSRYLPGADGHAGERRLGEVHRHLRLVAQALGEALQQRRRRRRA